MRRLFALVCLSLGPVLAQQEPPVFVGPPLPSPYQLRRAVVTAQVQIILATAGRVIDSPVVPRDKTLLVTSLLLVRDVKSGRTLWKRYLGDQYELEAVSPNAIELTNIEGPRKWQSLYGLRDGKLYGRAVLTTPTAIP